MLLEAFDPRLIYLDESKPSAHGFSQKIRYMDSECDPFQITVYATLLKSETMYPELYVNDFVLDKFREWHQYLRKKCPHLLPLIPDEACGWSLQLRQKLDLSEMNHNDSVEITLAFRVVSHSIKESSIQPELFALRLVHASIQYTGSDASSLKKNLELAHLDPIAVDLLPHFLICPCELVV